ncbi:cysteine and tyrosine-rich protein 1-like [Pecten maximus]|uniref:cysteine and tyrosine-rich protein 1-like n=1 Tax=Pecten maximus TaxID=6579 RepID=UPI0014580C8D|nr:cysteine and tyrosine-rich protein 1-like [Pecten maximus]
MADLIFMLPIFGILTDCAVAGEVCSGNVYYSVWYKYTVYCEHGCCGTYYDRECCGSLVGLIIGAVIGGICFIGGIIFLICLCHHCNKKQKVGGMVISQNQPQPGGNMAIVNSTNQPGVQPPGAYQHPGTYPGTYPPPGPNQVPMAAYPAPVVYGNPNEAPPAYPPPAAGQSNPFSMDQQLPQKH